MMLSQSAKLKADLSSHPKDTQTNTNLPLLFSADNSIDIKPFSSTKQIDRECTEHNAGGHRVWTTPLATAMTTPVITSTSCPLITNFTFLQEVQEYSHETKNALPTP